jgi:hypothetical protein
MKTLFSDRRGLFRFDFAQRLPLAFSFLFRLTGRKSVIGCWPAAALYHKSTLPSHSLRHTLGVLRMMSY